MNAFDRTITIRSAATEHSFSVCESNKTTLEIHQSVTSTGGSGKWEGHETQPYLWIYTKHNLRHNLLQRKALGSIYIPR